MDWSLISERLRVAKFDKATYATLYSNNGWSNKGSGHDLYVRKEVECQRRFQKLITDLVNHADSSGSGRRGGADDSISVGGGIDDDDDDDDVGGRKRLTTYSGSNTDKKEMSKGPWSAEEDRKVVELVKKYGPKKWSQIAQELPGEFIR